MIATLETLAARCHGDDRPDCPIIEGLAEAAARGIDLDQLPLDTGACLIATAGR